MMNTTYTFDDDTISDLHKDAHGMRPGQDFWQRWAEATAEEKQAEWDWLCQCVRRNAEADAIDRQRCIEAAEERIANLMTYGARNREMAIRWLDEAFQTNGDIEFLEYHLGVPFGYLRSKR